MEELLHTFLPTIVHIIEFLGIIIVVQGAIFAFYGYMKGLFNKVNYPVKFKFAEAMAMGLEFKLAAEILKTVIVQSLDEIFVLGAIFILRIIMTFIIHWELKQAHNYKSEIE